MSGVWARGEHMRILLIASAFNSLTQRVHAELADRGHQVSVELALGDEVMREGVRGFDPDLVVAPMLPPSRRHRQAAPAVPAGASADRLAGRAHG